ncbi:hypothetical protein INT45_006051, partial [Circinella minor]
MASIFQLLNENGSDEQGDIADDLDMDDDWVDENDPVPVADFNDEEEEGRVLQEYFKGLQQRFKKNGKIKEYENGTFWVHPKDPYFALMKSDLNPAALYLPRVFLWFPHLLIDKVLECPKCKEKALECSECKKKGSECSKHAKQSELRQKGYTQTPYARRVVDLNGCFYIMGYRYECKDKNCSAIFISNDARIIRQLPKVLQCEYPGYMTHQGGLSKTVGDLYRLCVQNSVGPKRFHNILRELHRLTYARRYLQYLQAVFIRQQQQPTLRQHLFKEEIISFSTFDDRSKYAGHVPSPQYLRSFYTAYLAELRSFMDKQMEILDGKYLKGDHTFKIIKLMSKVNGVPVFAALYTVLNEYEEIRLQFLVPTKSLSHLQYGFDKLREAYELYGHEQPEIFFTDNVIGDQGFLKSVFPSLLKDVIPVSEPATIEPLNIPSYPLLQIPKDEVVIRCISQYQDIDINLDEFIKKINNQSMQVIGLDCEWPVNQRTKRQGKFSTIQIAGHDTVLVCCVARLDKLPGSLCKLLESDTIVKVGRNVNGDLKKIERDFKIACKGGFELGAFCKSQGAINDGRMGLARICEAVLEHTLLKDDDIRLGNWDAPQLSQNQVEYAALDAWGSLKIFDEVKRHGIIGTRICKPVEI